MWRGCGEKGTLLHCWWECKLIQPLWRSVQRFLKKLGINLPYDPAIPLLGIYEEIIIEKDFYCYYFYIFKNCVILQIKSVLSEIGKKYIAFKILNTFNRN